MTSAAPPRYLPLGDAGLVVEFGGDEISDGANAAVLGLRAALEREHVPGVRETVPTYRSLLIVYDPLSVGAADLRASVVSRS